MFGHFLTAYCVLFCSTETLTFSTQAYIKNILYLQDMTQ